MNKNCENILYNYNYVNYENWENMSTFNILTHFNLGFGIRIKIKFDFWVKIKFDYEVRFQAIASK